VYPSFARPGPYLLLACLLKRHLCTASNWLAGRRWAFAPGEARRGRTPCLGGIFREKTWDEEHGDQPAKKTCATISNAREEDVRRSGESNVMFRITKQITDYTEKNEEQKKGNGKEEGQQALMKWQTIPYCLEDSVEMLRKDDSVCGKGVVYGGRKVREAGEYRTYASHPTDRARNDKHMGDMSL
jgi:hypothetical protein